MYQASKTLRHEVRPKGSLGGVSGAAVGRSDGGGKPRKIHFLPIFSPSTALSRLGWAGVKLRRQGLAGGGRGGFSGLPPKFAVWRYCGQGWAVRRSAVRRRCPFRRQPSAAPSAARRRRPPPQFAALRRVPPSAAAVRPPPCADMGAAWGLSPLRSYSERTPLQPPALPAPLRPLPPPFKP